MQLTLQPFDIPHPEPSLSLAVQAWHMMDFKIDYSAIPVVAEYLQIDDIELFITQLLQIKKHTDEQRENTHVK